MDSYYLPASVDAHCSTCPS